MAIVREHFRRNESRGVVPVFAHSSGIRRRRYFYERFDGNLVGGPLMWRVASGLTAPPTAAQGQTDGIMTPQGNFIEYFQTTAQTLQPVSHATKGLVLDGDQVDNETQEYVIGGNSTTQPLAFVTGTDDGFFIRATLELTVSNGSDQLLVGFRKAQAYAVPASFLTGGAATYTDFAGLGFATAVTTPNAVATSTSVGNAVNVVSATGFTWASTLIHKVEVRVVGRKAQYLINGVPLGGSVSKDALGATITAQATKTSAAYTFTSGLTLLPFIFVRQDAALLTAAYLRELEVGFLDDDA